MLGGVDQLLNRLVDIANEGQTGIGDHLYATREATVGHVVLHDLDRILILDLDAGDFVESYRVPESDQADLASCIVVEQRCLGRLATAYQGGVRRELAEEVGLSCTPRSQLD